MAQFFDPNITEDQSFAILSEEESKHVCKVLRMQSGDSLELVNGKGMLFYGTIAIADSRRCKVEITKIVKEEKLNTHIHVAIAPTKNMDRMEWLLEKATEIGMDEISFLSCDNSERKVLKMERLSKIVQGAMKQSKRLYLPKINELQSFDQFLKSHPSGLIAHCERLEDPLSREDTLANHWKSIDCPILIGPEGDFSTKEIEKAMHTGYQAIRLGKNRLRTETAGLYAVMQAKLLSDEQHF